MIPRNRFLRPKSRRRVALSCTAAFPDPQQIGVYSEFAAFREALNADIVVPHSQVALGQQLPPELSWLADSSSFIRPNAEIHRADYQHFRRMMPKRFASTMATLAKAIGCSTSDLDDRFEVHHACTYARLLRALEVDYIHTWYNYDQSLNAVVASMLLGIPRGITLCEGFDGDDWDLRIPGLHLEQADVIVAVSDATAATVQSLGGNAASAKCVRTGGPDAPAQILSRIDRAIEASSTSIVTRGVDAAYRESDARSRDLSSGVVPFMLLATERTGSNLLFEVLALESAHELFNPDYKADGYIPIFNQALHRDPELLRLREEDPEALLDRVWQIGKDAGFHAMGLKLMYFHGDIDYRATDYLLNSQDVRVFHVRRANRLSRFVSFERAKTSGDWYKTKRMGGDGPKGKIEIDVEQMLCDFLEQELLEEKYAALFRNHAMMDVTYEQFSADFETTRRDARRMLGVELLNTPVRSKKTGKRTMRDAIENADAVEQALRGTRFEAFLDQA